MIRIQRKWYLKGARPEKLGTSDSDSFFHSTTFKKINTLSTYPLTAQ